MGGFLIVNPRSGDGRTGTDELLDEARRRGIRTHVLEESDDPAEVARSADADALGIAGGDGSLAAVAGAALERDLPFVCVPFGTRNHFARDLGLDRSDPLGALAAFEGVDDDDDDDGPDTLRVRLTPVEARGFVNRALSVVAAGRLPCPLCGQPLDPQGHICPRRNGHLVN